MAQYGLRMPMECASPSRSRILGPTPLGAAPGHIDANGMRGPAGGAYLVRNEGSAVTVELRRAALAAQTGRRVHVTGKVVPSENATVPRRSGSPGDAGESVG